MFLALIARTFPSATARVVCIPTSNQAPNMAAATARNITDHISIFDRLTELVWAYILGSLSRATFG